MPEAEGSQAQNQSQRPNRGRNHGHRRGRGGKTRQLVDGSRSGGASAPSQSETFQSQAGSTATQRQIQASSEAPARSIPDGSNSNQRGRDRRPRGPRQVGRGSARHDAPRSFVHRSFGGHLTGVSGEAGDSAVSAAPSLSADAPEFVPGKPLVTRSKPTKPKTFAKPQVRLPKSTAEDLGTRIHEDIRNFNYECAICTDDICYCGRVEKQMPCFEREEPQMSYHIADQSWFDGTFTCDRLCERSFDCGIHKCSESCHPQEEQPAHCPYSPESVTHCPCGKTPLGELLKNARVSCEDPIPHCEEPCHKKLPCGHLCASKCHTGDCGFCNETIEVACICGRTRTRSVCHQGNVQSPMCMRICQANLSCGRHKCGEHCCAGEKKAAERQAARRKHKLPSEVTSIEAEHICIKTCGRQLKCGSHECQQICHRGPCANCPEAIFTEISCDCGRTVLHPPQPCGTRPPDCRFNCLRRPSCGHPSVEHNCHAGDISCPKCPFLVEKWCACGKEKIHSQPCHLQEAHCGRVCGKKLKCGLHSCKKLCHRPGECEDANLSGKRCEQACGKTKLFCEHPCQNTCHGQTACNESSACTAKAVISCPCGVRTQEVKCLASSSNATPSRIEIKCDDECLRLERNRRLAAALNIDPTSHQNDHIPYSDTTLRLFKENTSWAETQEREFRVFAKSPNEVRLRYKPMSTTYRQFLHVLAEDYGLESRSEDIEPYRYVVVFKGTRFVSAPSKTLSQCTKIRAAQAADAASAAASRAPSPPLTAQDPFNGFLLTSPRFGLTIDDVKAALNSDLSTQPSVHFEISFLPSDEVLLRATTSYSSFLSPPALEQVLISLKPRIARTIQGSDVAGKVFLCHVDSAGHVARRDDVSKTDASGWSAVAGRAAAKLDTAVEEAPRTTGRRLVGLRKKKIERERSWTQELDGDVEC
ncbi:hypothetical protein MHUMG1_06701 [Metarhizium humberi]|uniref:R3H domain-containing protein n=1 Tax=Metarhizium humberi TaxID=2596975 RepID=A0A9P8M6I2_9HYPO|nr:hypothetical protein MHUMG1_06701 [Metarhizium humberi]